MRRRRKGAAAPRRGRKARDADADGSDSEGKESAPSVASEASFAHNASKGAAVVDVADLVEKLSEKRGATRAQALQRLCKALQENAELSAIESHIETISLYVSNMIKRGSGDEVVAACSAPPLLCIAFADRADRTAGDFLPALVEILRSEKKGLRVRAAAARSLATLVFVAAENSLGEFVESREIERHMELLLGAACLFARRARVLEEDEADLVVEALHGWTLLCSALPEARQAGAVFEQRVPLLLSMLESETIEVRVAAGEAIAVLLVAHRSCKLPEYRPMAPPPRLRLRSESEVSTSDGTILDQARALQGVSASAEPLDAGSSEAKAAGAVGQRPSQVDLKLLAERLGALANDASRYRARKSLQQQRSVFREIAATAERNEEPSEQLRLGSFRVTIQGWAALCQLDDMRYWLEGGLPVHLSSNEFLRALFNVRHVAPGSDEETALQATPSKQDMLLQARARERERDERDRSARKLKRAAAGQEGEDDLQ